MGGAHRGERGGAREGGAEKKEKEAKVAQEKALKRKADLTAEAERRVQQETIANAAKRTLTHRG